MPHRTALIVLASLATLAAGHADAQSSGSRAEEEASRPMRLILEAAKIKPKARPAEATPPAARPSVVPARPAAAAAVPAAPGAAAAALATSESPTAPAPGLAESTVATVEAAAVPRSSEPAAAPVATAAPQTQPEPAEALPPLKLRSLVEPITPRHLAGRLRGEVRVEVQLNVAADGSVSEAAVMASSHPQMNAAVLDAVRQWRYEPAGRAREHAVQVVLRPDS